MGFTGCTVGDATYVGVDLGTANCCMAYTEGDGSVSVLRYDEDNDIMPSEITFTDEGIYVGLDSVNAGRRHSSWNTVSHFKRSMGEDVYRVFNGVRYDSTELSSLMLTKMFKRFKEVTGGDVRKAVITVPSDYGDVERHSTYKAARIAGVDKVFLLTESLAAAIAYGIYRPSDVPRNLMIYDLGTGTLDVSVVNVEGGVFRVLSDESNKDIGGRDWDLQLASIIQKKVLDYAGIRSMDIISDNEFRRSVMVATEAAKIQLETSTKASGSVELKGNSVEFSISREEFENSTSWLMIKTIDMMGRAIRNADLTMGDIDTIVMVGGASMMLQVPRAISAAFPSSEIVPFNPQHAIAIGAALFASSYFGDERNIEVIPVMTKTYGFMSGIDGVEKICNVIYKNTPTPSTVKISCRPKRDDQEQLELKIYESQSRKGEEFIDEDDAKYVTTFSVPLSGKISRGRTKIPITVSTDEYGRVLFQVECNGEVREYTFIDGIRLNEDELIVSRKKLEGII